LEARRRAERALCAVVAQAYVEGVSTRKVEEVAGQMGITSLSKSQVSRLCGEIDELVAAWRTSPLADGPYPLMWIDALALKVREGGRVVAHQRADRQPRQRRRTPRDPRVGTWQRRGRRHLDQIPALAGHPRAARRAAGHL
jgi:hypothetical protein